MKIITVPADVKVKVDGSETDIFTFKKVLLDHLDGYGAEFKTITQQRQAGKIMDKIESANGHFQLEEAEYEILKAACARAAYKSVRISKQLDSYIVAVEKAEDVKT